MVTLASYLTGIGVTISQGVSLLEATGVSADGRTIVGYTGLPGQVRQGFVATIPAPGEAALLALTLTAAYRRRR